MCSISLPRALLQRRSDQYHLLPSQAKIRKSKQLRLNIKRKEQEPPVPTVGLPYATDKAEVRNDETIKGSDSAHAAGTLNLFLSMDKDMKKRSCRIRFPQASL